MSAQGFEAMGKPVPYERREAALVALRDMGITDTGEAMGIIDPVADLLARDRPYEAQKAAMNRGLDLTGTYRLFAHLLTG